jgi:ubiquitin related modifier 1
MAYSAATAHGTFSIPITVEFTCVKLFSNEPRQDCANRLYSGGLELLFGNERKHKVILPPHLEDGSRPNISYLLKHLVDNLMKDSRTDMFIMEDNVYVTRTLHLNIANIPHRRPGILVLINDADWELEGEETYELQQGDNIVFVSTLHGG